MKCNSLSHTAKLLLMATLILTGATADAQTTANGPYYATPSWDQQLGSTRFIVLSNWVDANFPSGGAAVLDRETGLVWQRSPSTSLNTWSEAKNLCNGIATLTPSAMKVCSTLVVNDQ